MLEKMVVSSLNTAASLMTNLQLKDWEHSTTGALTTSKLAHSRLGQPESSCNNFCRKKN